VGELADVVNVHLAGQRAHLAPSRQEPGDQLFAGGGDRGWLAVGEDRRLLPFERNSAEPGGQWLLPSRSTLNCKQVRGPCGVPILAL
jgi:hypothetical protein